MESENDLLSRERDNLEQELHRVAGTAQQAADLRTELAAKDAEREAFAEHFQKLEEEREAEKEARKVVERGLDDALARGREAEDKVRVTSNLALSLEQTARMAEEERAGEAKRRNELEHKLAEQNSIYEAR